MAQNSKKIRKKISWLNPLLWTSVIVVPMFSIAGLIYAFESGLATAKIKTFWDALWWTAVTMSTVGYGDLTPITPEGKIVAVIAFITGITLIAVLTANIASRLIERLVIKVKTKETGNLKNHILVLGWNENGEKIIGNIERDCEKDTEIVVMCASDKDINLPEGIIFVSGNFTKLDELKKVSAQNAKVALVLADNTSTDTDSRAILTVMALKRISNGRVRCIVEVFSSEDREYLESAGADEIIVRSELAGSILSRTVYNPGMGEFLQDLVKFEGTSTVLIRDALPEQIGMRFGDLLKNLYKAGNEILLGLSRNSKIMTNPDSDETIIANDKLYILSPELACTVKGH